MKLKDMFDKLVEDINKRSSTDSAGSQVNLNTASGLGMKKGGSVKKAKPKCMARGGGCEVRGKTKGRFV